MYANGIILRPYRDGDEVALRQLHYAVVGEKHREHWLKWWHWQFNENPAGKPIYWVAEIGDKLVGQYTIIPVKLKVGNEIIIGYQSVDTMTHPDYRHRGIFVNLATKTYEVAGNNAVIYGFPNQYSYLGFIKKLGWFEVGTIDAMVKPLWFPNTKKTDSEITTTEILSFDNRINDFWADVSNDHETMVVRDKEYLNWRYVTVPDVNFRIYLAEKGEKILGYIVVKCEYQYRLNIGRIFDLVVRQEPVGQALIQKAIEYFKSQRAILALYRLIAPENYHRMLRKSGFMTLPLMNKKAHFIVRPNTTKRWFVQTGDADTL